MQKVRQKGTYEIFLVNRAPSVLISSGSAPFLRSLPTACQIIVVQLLQAKPAVLCVQSPGFISSPLTANKWNQDFTEMGEEYINRFMYSPIVSRFGLKRLQND